MLPSLQIIHASYEKCARLFEKLIFPYLKAKKEEFGYQKEQYTLITMDSFEGQDNAEIKALCLKMIASCLLYGITWPTSFSPLIFLSIKKQGSSSPINSAHGS